MRVLGAPVAGGPGRGHEGAAALEVALVLPLVALLLGALLAVSAVVADQLAVAQAARAGARTMAVTAERDSAVSAAVAVAPRARVGLTVRSGVVTVTVRGGGRILGVPYAVDAVASAPLEPAVR